MTLSMSKPAVFLVDDDAGARRALRRGLLAAGLQVIACESADAFLAIHEPAQPGCLVTDVAMPGMNGLELQALLKSRGCTRPTIFVTAQGNIPMSVQAMRAGAVTFLPKPVRLAELVAAVQEAFALDARLRTEQADRTDIALRLGALTAREREVLTGVVTGKLNKQIAAELGAAEKTIKVHRGRVMSKLQVRSVAELVHLTARIGL
jgi:FixJ family two-component response regulator